MKTLVLLSCMDHRLTIPLFKTIVGCSLICFSYHNTVSAQTKTLDGKEYKAYRPGYFKPKLKLNYMLYSSALITVDPLDIGGKSAYAISLGGRINLWELKSQVKAFSGLKVNGWYLGGGYEYYPQQYDKVYGSLWIRIKTFIQFVGRMDAVYSYGYGLHGVGSRYCAGFEVKKITVLVCGELFGSNQPKHPHYKSEYFNQGAIFVIVPLYTRR